MSVDWGKVAEVAERYRERLLSLPGVVGMSTGVTRDSGEARPCIRVYLREPAERGALRDGKVPRELEGIPVDVTVTGDIVAFGSRSETPDGPVV